MCVSAALVAYSFKVPFHAFESDFFKAVLEKVYTVFNQVHLLAS